MTNKTAFKYIGISIVFTLAATICLLIVNYADLPEQIPVHYNHKGEVDNYGPKNFLWILPILASLMCYGIMKSHKWLPKLNPKITDNELYVLSWGSYLLSFLLAISFSYITIKTIIIAKNGSGNLGAWFLPVFAIGMIVFPLLPLFWQRRKR